ncbi:MAG TPA: hypothetical protein VN578_03630 [Candidatus Binatia bacterium]|jgi:hypothetical protein|nr:hypothetical protein [Candidatus Binatia bacterium]
MGLDATVRRRWVGALALLAALVMLVAGQTVLEGRLTPVAFLVYWLVCVILTGLAIFVAFADVRALAYRTHREQRDLLQNTLKEIETEARRKARQPPAGDAK